MEKVNENVPPRVWVYARCPGSYTATKNQAEFLALRARLSGATVAGISMDTKTGWNRPGYGRNIKYAKLRPKGSQRAIRFRSLGPGYSEQELRARLEQPKNDTASRMGQRERAAPLVHKKVRFHGSYRKHTHKKITGFMALYYHYHRIFLA